jgi:transposase
MFRVEIYGRVRRAVLVEGRSQREVAREFGISRKTIQKMLRYAVPPGYQRQQPVQRPKLGPWVGMIDAMQEEDQRRPAKQRHTAKRIFERLREEHGFTGGYTIVKDYVRSAALRGREMFVPLVHPAGEAQADFGEALAVIGGVETPHAPPIQLLPALLLDYFCSAPVAPFYSALDRAVSAIRERVPLYAELTFISRVTGETPDALCWPQL